MVFVGRSCAKVAFQIRFFFYIMKKNCLESYPVFRINSFKLFMLFIWYETYTKKKSMLNIMDISNLYVMVLKVSVTFESHELFFMYHTHDHFMFIQKIDFTFKTIKIYIIPFMVV